MRIALFDYIVTPQNAVGNCDRILMEGLCDEHDITVFAVEFDNPNPERITFVRVPAPKKPLFLLYIVYFLISPVVLFLHQRRHKVKFDLIQSIESISLVGTQAYSHFCHRAYLNNHWNATKPTGLRRYARWLNHQLFALMEPLVYRRVKRVIVPSRGLARELTALYTDILPKNGVHIIANPVKIDRMQRPTAFDRDSQRAQLGFQPDDLVFVFIALGHFERKGLPLLLEAAAQTGLDAVKLLVVGGSEAMIADYKARASALGIADRMVFVGLQQDVRPYLWASDVFAFPSSYEVFPLVSLEAAAAGLPLLTTPLNGVEEFLVEGVNGWCVERTSAALTEKMQYIVANRGLLPAVGKAAADSVRQYSAEAFVANWRELLST